MVIMGVMPMDCFAVKFSFWVLQQRYNVLTVNGLVQGKRTAVSFYEGRIEIIRNGWLGADGVCFDHHRILYDQGTRMPPSLREPFSPLRGAKSLTIFSDSSL